MSPPLAETPFSYAGLKRHNPRGLKLTDEQVIHLRDRRFCGTSSRDFAKMYGVSYQCIYNARSGITFKHLNLAYPPYM